MQTLDIFVIIAYLAAIIWAGLRGRNPQQSADEFFTAKGGFSSRLETVMVGLSMAATLFSGISFVVYTSSAYSDGARIVMAVIGMPLAWLVLRYWFLPRYLSGGGSHPYDIVEQRFGKTVRLCLSAMFIFLRLGWMAVMLVAPTLVLMGAADLGQEWFWPIVAATGLVCTLYTTVGGIRGVIVADAIQFAVMAVGVLFIIGFILFKIDLAPGVVVTQLAEAGRLQVLDFTFDLTDPFNLWGVLVGLSVANLGSYTGDLMMLQRYLASDSPRTAARAFSINIWGAISVIILLVVAGLLLWIWYERHPDPNLPGKADQVLAYFIAHELPAGLSGLLIAAILAATMSSMTSGIIALAGTLMNDWVQRWCQPTPMQQLRWGRYLSVAIGVLAVLAAGFASQLGTLFQISQVVLGAFLGPMLGCMVLVVSGWKMRSRVVLLGIGLGTITGWVVIWSSISGVWVATAAALVTLLVPLIFGRQTR